MSQNDDYKQAIALDFFQRKSKLEKIVEVYHQWCKHFTFGLLTGVGRFHSSMHKWGLAPSPNCECGASEQTADHVLTACPIHRAPHGARGLTVLDDETRCCLNDITASI